MTLTADGNCYSVSVVIPAYNIESYLARAIDSVLAQTLVPDEIIVVDDGSTDQTATAAQQYGSRIRYIYQPNAGLSAARNTGIRTATGTWIALLDGDDEWLPDKLRLQIELLQRNPELVWACANCYFHLVHLNKRVMNHVPESMQSHLAGREFLEDYLIAANYGAVGHPNTMIFKRQILFEAGLFREGLAFHEDHDMWWRIAYRWPRIGYLPQPLAIYYHNRPGSLTNKILRTQQMEVLYELLDRHLRMAEHYGRLSALRTRLGCYLAWISDKLFEEKQYKHILKILHRYGYTFSRRNRTEICLRATFPHAASWFQNTYTWLRRNVFGKR
jgi:glycosyltransferase involved in cell wall biosynthesis